MCENKKDVLFFKCLNVVLEFCIAGFDVKTSHCQTQTSTTFYLNAACVLCLQIQLLLLFRNCSQEDVPAQSVYCTFESKDI